MRISDLSPEDLKKAMDNTIKQKSIHHWNKAVDRNQKILELFMFRDSDEGFLYWYDLVNGFFILNHS